MGSSGKTAKQYTVTEMNKKFAKTFVCIVSRYGRESCVTGKGDRGKLQAMESGSGEEWREQVG